MRKLIPLLAVLFVAGAPTIAAAQTPTDTDRVARADRDDNGEWGWFGLLGLAGLIGLKRRDREDHVHSRTATTR